MPVPWKLHSPRRGGSRMTARAQRKGPAPRSLLRHRGFPPIVCLRALLAILQVFQETSKVDAGVRNGCSRARTRSTNASGHSIRGSDTPVEGFGPLSSSCTES